MLKRILSVLTNLVFITLVTIQICYVLFEGFGFGNVPQSWVPTQTRAGGEVAIATEDLMKALYLWTGMWLVAIAFVISFLVFVSWTIWDVTPGRLLFLRRTKKLTL